MAEPPESERDPHHADKIEIVEGLLRALDDMDRINQVVRGSADRSVPGPR
ncbi:MAG TPA: hypothetical protein VK672_07710 [Solirubrobacteraceae bacterium]|nr:hypothetical protein [Solirubrobacteraceae bacterium]